MNDKEKADALVELHKFRLEHFNKTRDLEFKVNIAFWTLIAVGVYSLKETTGIFSETNVCTCAIGICVYVILSLLLICLHSFWMYFIQKSEDTDNFFMIKYRKVIVELIETGINTTPIPTAPETTEINWKWIIVEVGFTVILLAFGFFYLLSP